MRKRTIRITSGTENSNPAPNSGARHESGVAGWLHIRRHLVAITELA